MAEKFSTLILNVNLGCCRCSKKLRKILSKFCVIRTQSFDSTKNIIILSGPFDPETLAKKICCKAGCLVHGYEIPKLDPPKQPPPKPSTPSPPVPEPPPPTKPKSPANPEPKPSTPSTPAPEPPPPTKPKSPANPEPNPDIPPIRVCCRGCYDGFEWNKLCEMECHVYHEEEFCRTM